MSTGSKGFAKNLVSQSGIDGIRVLSPLLEMFRWSLAAKSCLLVGPKTNWSCWAGIVTNWSQSSLNITNIWSVVCGVLGGATHEMVSIKMVCHVKHLHVVMVVYNPFMREQTCVLVFCKPWHFMTKVKTRLGTPTHSHTCSNDKNCITIPLLHQRHQPLNHVLFIHDQSCNHFRRKVTKMILLVVQLKKSFSSWCH